MTKQIKQTQPPSLPPQRFPKAVVFDLDFTLWPLWCDTHISNPIKVHSSSPTKITLVDRTGFKFSLFPDVKPILDLLRENNVMIFTASRTCDPPMARKLIRLFELEEHIDDSEWGYGTKIQHLTALSKRNHVPFEEMCLFDDEYRNKDVEKIGVKFCYLPNEEINWKLFWEGLKSWQQASKVDGNVDDDNY
ncbi:hypothetical protein CANARDRAFT_5480 [[Candida] arabinofermentans NRRL YB-2248]|uniref:Magnesium-dependent phosphatase-1 n=1 Tax=[Candida] arabinofermentans NRRL YB-2248 TaxID=983967 RepID=A0A1E4T8Y0_9ASCO|nr:hypothetical protein CANARDRAFT_5480 [[Candida] arabinofermentans NRRL YB-2248]